MAHRILVVDDTNDMRDMLLVFLRSRGFEVTGCSLGQEALLRYHSALVNQNPYFGIILDLALPDVDGFAVARNIRNLEQFAHSIPYTYLIAYTAHHDIVSLSTLPDTVKFDEYVSKVEPPENLTKAIERALADAEAKAATVTPEIALDNFSKVV